MRSGAGTALLVAALLLAGCSEQELAQPVRPSAAPTATSAPSPTPSPSPSPAPLSAFEGDPAVQGLRTYLSALAAALNAGDLQLPALVAASTPERAALHQELFAEDLGQYYPGPVPLEVLGVRAVSADQKQVLGCVVDGGFGLTGPGGTPAEPLEIVSTQTDIRLVDGTWKVADAVLADGVDCTGLTLEDFR